MSFLSGCLPILPFCQMTEALHCWTAHFSVQWHFCAAVHNLSGNKHVKLSHKHGRGKLYSWETSNLYVCAETLLHSLSSFRGPQIKVCARLTDKIMGFKWAEMGRQDWKGSLTNWRKTIFLFFPLPQKFSVKLLPWIMDTDLCMDGCVWVLVPASWAKANWFICSHSSVPLDEQGVSAITL